MRNFKTQLSSELNSKNFELEIIDEGVMLLIFPKVNELSIEINYSVTERSERISAGYYEHNFIEHDIVIDSLAVENNEVETFFIGGNFDNKIESILENIIDNQLN
jgi:hypothetical protein